MANTFTVVRADIESRLQGYDFTDIATFVDALIEERGEEWTDFLDREGVDPAAASATTRLLQRSRRYIINMVAADLQDSLTHQATPLSDRMRKTANLAREYLHASPESAVDDWNTNDQRGSWRSNVLMTGLRPGETLTGTQTTSGGFHGHARRLCGNLPFHKHMKF